MVAEKSLSLRVLIGCEEQNVFNQQFQCDIMDRPAGCFQHTDRPNRNGSSEDHVMAAKALPSPEVLRQLIECGGMPVPMFPHYVATLDGEVVSLHRRLPNVMRRRPHRNGYNIITLFSPSGERMQTTLHRVVAMAFHENPHGLPCVRHLDGNKSNCRPENLAWGSYADNEADKIAIGRRRYGTAKMKLRRDDRDKAKLLFDAGVSRKELAAMFCVNRSTISRLISGVTWENRKWPMASGADER